ncbi:hypothetical protein BYT27DRAFT_7084412, partial [Phlegmacium glaucopus]
NGSFKDASEIQWVDDPYDEITPASKCNPIYHFYKEVSLNKEGKPGKVGDKHYKCYHSNRKILTITKAMNYSLNGTDIILKNRRQVQQ